jgi:hypothetical protein
MLNMAISVSVPVPRLAGVAVSALAMSTVTAMPEEVRGEKNHRHHDPDPVLR